MRCRVMISKKDTTTHGMGPFQPAIVDEDGVPNVGMSTFESIHELMITLWMLRSIHAGQGTVCRMIGLDDDSHTIECHVDFEFR